MTTSRKLLKLINRLLSPVNLYLESRTAENAEEQRLFAFSAAGGFHGQQYPIPDSFAESDHMKVLSWLPEFQSRFESFSDRTKNDVAFGYGNRFFEPIDTEVLYSIVRKFDPRRIVEIGCGNSTRIIRQAIIDGKLTTSHCCIDPVPRVDIAYLAENVMRKRVETLNPIEIAGPLEEGDILFIDTSHEVNPANDVAYIYGKLLPILKPGVIVHIHDIFTPFEYPESIVRRPDGKWGEQYLIQLMLERRDRWKVLWPGYYLQQTLSDFGTHFPRAGTCNAQSLWLVAQ
jgi:predicted O-methyltransferase YrrM